MWKKGLLTPKTKVKKVKKPIPKKAAKAPPKAETFAYIPVICPSCGKPNFPHVKYCAECGRKLSKGEE